MDGARKPSYVKIQLDRTIERFSAVMLIISVVSGLFSELSLNYIFSYGCFSDSNCAPVFIDWISSSKKRKHILPLPSDDVIQ